MTPSAAVSVTPLPSVTSPEKTAVPDAAVPPSVRVEAAAWRPTAATS